MLSIINSVVRGIVELLKQFALPLAAFFRGKRSAELARLKKEAKDARKDEKIRDGVSRADDNDLDDILHD